MADSGIYRPRRAVLLAAGAMALVALAAGALSWNALAALAERVNQPWWAAPLYPVTVDGMLAIGTVAAVVCRESRRRTRAQVWALIIVAIAVSVAGNASHAGTLELWALGASAVPSAALAASLHLLVIVVRVAGARPARTRAEPSHTRGPRPARARRARHDAPGRLAERMRVLHARGTPIGDIARAVRRSEDHVRAVLGVHGEERAGAA